MTENTVKQVVLDDEQQQAVSLCTTIDTQHRIVSVTGQAGTGKTTILRKAYQTLTDAGYLAHCLHQQVKLQSVSQK
jgi:type II secretory pathway predicted ATPase ExeA